MKEKILITGGSGFVGGHLTKRLLKEGFDVVHLSRSVNSRHGVKTFEWDLKKKTINENALDGVSYIVHLSGVHFS